MKKLDFNEPQKVGYCISESLRNEQIKININKVKGRVTAAEELIKEPIAIVGFGPSLNKTWKQIKKFKYIMTCSGAHKFLVEKGIIPTHHLDLDPRKHKASMLGKPQKGTQYLIASTIYPTYLDALDGYDVKLWHIFASEEEAARVLPRGEWMLSGGSSVGSRCMTMARFLGFTDLHIFGMDGSMNDGKSHTTEHPNAPKTSFETEYNGKKFLTTPSMLHVAKETFHELDQMGDVTAKFYGNGLIQEIAKNYKPNLKHGSMIAFNKPQLISDEYKELNYKLHQDNPTYGMGGSRHAETVIKLAETLITPENKFVKCLDYGAGKGTLAKSLPFSINEYDPAIPGKDESPQPADLVICTDVLEHIEEDKINFVLEDLKRVTKQIGYFVISTRKAVKTYANGKNAHNIVQGKDWWHKKLSKFFDIGTIIEKEKESELYIVVSPKSDAKNANIRKIDFDGKQVKFNVPNDTVKWRCDTIFTKEPVTIDWIRSFKEGEVLIDVGANMGGYSLLAASKGVKVVAFEPEAENYALLQKNIVTNNANVLAYCAAVTDKAKLDKLYLSQAGVGGSCHSFGERQGKIVQGSVGLALDELDVHPDHIKIDVDGQEPKVIEGALKLLSNGVKSVLIEVNTNIPEHNEMVKKIESLGFSYDKSQVESSMRKEGNFKGCAEFLFRKDKKKDSKPYPYFIQNNFFSEKDYTGILKNMANLKYQTLEEARGTKGYPERFVCYPKGRFWDKITKQMLDGSTKNWLCEKFGLVADEYTEDLLLIKDKPGYKIGVHRDRVDKVVTMLIYLAKDDSSAHAGTTVYVPKKEGFKCKIGTHYGFDEFNKLETIPYLPNTAFVFLNSDTSFHGVEPCDVERNVLLYNLNKKK